MRYLYRGVTYINRLALIANLGERQMNEEEAIAWQKVKALTAQLPAVKKEFGRLTDAVQVEGKIFTPHPAAFATYKAHLADIDQANRELSAVRRRYLKPGEKLGKLVKD